MNRNLSYAAAALTLALAAGIPATGAQAAWPHVAAQAVERAAGPDQSLLRRARIKGICIGASGCFKPKPKRERRPNVEDHRDPDESVQDHRNGTNTRDHRYDPRWNPRDNGSSDPRWNPRSESSGDDQRWNPRSESSGDDQR